ncbi:LacI family DNA-binding transcriptional regulator [Alteromonas sp. 1_MG-2023]|uniref:LacI family DNA-binding transcriptional regulator n=1 Tax=Alteromonas sp. 1_MG-2023 TaxID=3062669 RepID=UPI0026E145F3|nr:LacI family DNA-binding transcriptional regulator [Alteromonas sp. 1_MG-2023]MDO6474501.1 LacI family DNA-binding transcriptional regulator [Alteromonas sp. 1_MG-2023]
MKSERNLTLSDLARIAGVSTSTASRALNDNPVIKQSTRERIQALAKEHNFSINAAASRLRTQRTNVVAVILNLIEHTEQSINDPFLLKVVGDLNQALNDKGYELLLSNSFMATDDWYNYFINSRRADGLIVVGQGKSEQKAIDAAKAGAPLVVWGDPNSQSGYPIIGSNNRLGGKLATQHLIESGHKRLVFLGDTGHAEMGERYAGYVEAHNEAGLEHDTALIFPIDLTSQAAYNKINETILQHGLNFDGIVACSDMVALGALKALKERYIAIPGEVGIIGFDDIAMAELLHPALTTIRQNTREAASVMVTQLLNQLNGKPAFSEVIDIELIVRKSAS